MGATKAKKFLAEGGESPIESLKMRELDKVKTYRLRVVFEPDEDDRNGWSVCCPALEDNGALAWGQTWEQAHESIIKILETIVGSMIESDLAIPQELGESGSLGENQALVTIQPKLKPSKTSTLTKGYRFRIELEPDEDVWFVRCPILEPYGAATWGETQDQARERMQEVLCLVLETMLEEGIPIPDEPESYLLQGECLVVNV